MSSYDRCVEVIENSDLPPEVTERVIDSLGFTQSFHDFMKDWQMLKEAVEEDSININDLEASFEALIGEFQAACIFLASIKDSEKGILETYKNLSSKEVNAVPSLVIEGYKQLASRVKNTRNTLKDIDGPHTSNG